MAEGLARALAGSLGMDMEFSSAGTLGIEDALATPEAIVVAAELGVDISNHLSRALNRDIARAADFIFGMEYAHLESVKHICERGSRISLLGGKREIPDPIGCDIDFYRTVRDMIWLELQRVLTEIANEK